MPGGRLVGGPRIEIVINLTPHKVHGPLGIKILEAGKSVYNEKPFAVYREDGQKMLALATAKGLRVGGSPATFFGGAWQMARKLIDEGAIGEVVGASPCLLARHAPPPSARAGARTEAKPSYVSFYSTDFFEFGVTWSFDRGPYYLNALINLLGPVSRVTGSARATWTERMENDGSMVQVHTPTHFASVMDFASGAVGTFTITSDAYDTGLPHIEIYGAKGSLRCIDPNNFGGTIYLRTADSPELVPVETVFGYNGNSRGVGVADMAAALRSGRPHRASGEMAYHAVDIVHAMHEASAQNRHIMLASTCAQPAALPEGLADWTIDA